MCLTGVLVHICHPSMQETEAKGRSSWHILANSQAQGQLVLQKRLSPKNKKKKNKKMVFCWILDLVILCACFVCSCSHVAMYVPRACRDQKRALDSLELELWMVVNHYQWWEQDPQPLQEQHVFSITGPSLQHLDSFIYKGLILCKSSASFREFKKPLYHSFKLTQHKILDILVFWIMLTWKVSLWPLIAR